MSDPPSRLKDALSGRYRVHHQLGEGGMATVYLADDLKHERQVALKVLKPELAAAVGAERFLAEIKTTANLQHPHILPLYDSGEADGLLFYVMPYVEGESLRDRLDRERQLPVDDAVVIATNMAEALDYAHRRGVIHRDIKPANVLLQDGKPVISDFGIALALGAAGGGRLTETGLSLGTPHYMSPEQAIGDQTVGPAADVYALGCVLYEMLVGEPPFTGSSPQAVLGKIITALPDRPGAVRRAVPANVDGVIAKALEKVPADRFSVASDVARALADDSFRWGGRDAASGEAGAGAEVWRPLALVLTVVVIVLSGTMLIRDRETLPDPEWRRIQVLPPEGLGQLQVFIGSEVSPDGRMFAFRVPDQRALALRSLSTLDSVVVRGTEGLNPANPRFSPDGSALAFVSVAEQTIAWLPIGGGVPRVLADSLTLGLSEPAWVDDTTILFSGRSGGLSRVSTDGGSPELILAPGEGLGLIVGVSSLPEGRGALLTACPDASCGVASIWGYDLETGDVTELYAGATRAWYMTRTETLVVGLESGTLVAAPMDLGTLEVRGTFVPVLNGVAASGPTVAARVSSGGTLLYLEEEAVLVGRGEHWPVMVDRNGRSEPIDPEWIGRFTTPALSRDGGQLAIAEGEGLSTDIVVRELPNGPTTRLTNDQMWNRRPAWAPDGRSVVFQSSIVGQGGTEDQFLRIRRADASQPVSMFLDLDVSIHQIDWSPTGDDLVLRLGANNRAGETSDLWRMTLSADSSVRPLLQGHYNEWSPALSPDGRWLAFASGASGRAEIVVRPFPDVDAEQIQVSINGGIEPRWSPLGDELFYRSLEAHRPDEPDRLVAAAVDVSDGFRVISRTDLFDWDFGSAAGHASYDVTADASSFVMIGYVDDDSPGPIPVHVVVDNFDELVRRQLEGT